MSLSKLPPRLLAQICSHLEFKDIINLLQVNKRINGNLKYYKLDKPKIFQLSFYYRRRHVRLDVEMQVVENDENLQTIKVIKFLHEVDNISDYFDTVEKFAYITEIFYTKCNINEELAEKLLKTATKIKQFHVLSASLNISEDMFLKLCDRFELITLSNVKYPCLESNEFLGRVIQKCNIHIEGKYELVGLITDERETEISDVILEALKCEYPPTTFRIENWINNITIGGLKELFEVIVAKNPETLNWNFGLIKTAETEPATAFLEDIKNGRYPNYKQESKRIVFWTRCFITRTDGLNKFEFSFCFLHEEYDNPVDDIFDQDMVREFAANIRDRDSYSGSGSDEYDYIDSESDSDSDEYENLDENI